MTFKAKLLAACAALCAMTAVANAKIEHVVLISVDGLHASDLARFVAKNPQSTLATLAAHGVTYSNAMTTFPSDSFPGLLSMLTGGTPRSTGVYYDDAYIREYSSAKECKAGEKPAGAEYDYSEAADIDDNAFDTQLDPKKLLADPANNCAPVYPHSIVRVNNIFEVAKAAGLRTAWADKHPAYDLVQGPSGKGVDDLFAPEINADGTTDSVDKTIAYDATKVAAIVNELKGFDHAGKTKAGAPAILGMNFQAISVAQKLKGVGYMNAAGEPSEGLAKALTETDKALGRVRDALVAEKLLDTTLVIVSAKHGQSPIDPDKRKIVDSKALKAALNGMAAQVTTDDVALIWLKEPAKTAEVVALLEAKKAELSIDKIWSGDELAKAVADASKDSRVPNIIVQPVAGVIFTKPTATKIAEHGGGAEDDRHVAMLVSYPALGATTNADAVSTTQVAPTILKALGLDAGKLDAVKSEGTAALPALDALAAK